MKGVLILCILLLCSNLAANEHQAPIIIDVRSIQEYNAGHIKGAIHIPYQEIGNKISTHTKTKDDNIILYCAKGGRAGKALTTLEKLGYINAKNAGGIDDLRTQLKTSSKTK